MVLKNKMGKRESLYSSVSEQGAESAMQLDRLQVEVGALRSKEHWERIKRLVPVTEHEARVSHGRHRNTVPKGSSVRKAEKAERQSDKTPIQKRINLKLAVLQSYRSGGPGL